MTGLKDEIYTSELSESGSLAIDTTNTGVVSARLIRPVYNLKEMARSIDTQFTELVRDENEMTVLQSVYDDTLLEIEELKKEVQQLNTTLSDKQNDIAILNREKSALDQELTTKNRTIRNLEFQLEASNNQITELIQQFRNILSGIGDVSDFDMFVTDSDDISGLPKPVLNIEVSTTIQDRALEITDMNAYNVTLHCKLLNIDMDNIQEFGYIYGSNSDIDLSQNNGMINDVDVSENTFTHTFRVTDMTGDKYYRGFAVSKNGKVGYSPSRYIEYLEVDTDDENGVTDTPDMDVQV